MSDVHRRDNTGLSGFVNERYGPQYLGLNRGDEKAVTTRKVSPMNTTTHHDADAWAEYFAREDERERVTAAHNPTCPDWCERTDHPALEDDNSPAGASRWMFQHETSRNVGGLSVSLLRDELVTGEHLGTQIVIDGGMDAVYFQIEDAQHLTRVLGSLVALGGEQV